MMRLKVLLPTEVLIDQDVSKVTAEAENGCFCLLPKHLDFVATLVPGLLFFESGEGHEAFIGISEGVLVKQGQNVFVSTKDAVTGPDLGTLETAVKEKFLNLTEREENARVAVSKFEADFLRRFLELQQHD